MVNREEEDEITCERRRRRPPAARRRRRRYEEEEEEEEPEEDDERIRVRARESERGFVSLCVASVAEEGFRKNGLGFIKSGLINYLTWAELKIRTGLGLIIK